jgi:hypothetical protein
MNASEIIRQFESLSSAEQTKVRDWILTREIKESPDVLRALDAATLAADQRGTTPVNQVRQMLPRWTSKSA